ncbi:hypothetical protein CPB85DRAFT_1391918 [Mucidula mucida]|nr:hypothetical protein CPB85DRAFT_1391918 [Mucidula mucida]
MPPRRSQRIAAASSTSRPTRSATPKSIPGAPPVPKPAAKRRRMATPESEEDDVEDDADADDDDDSGNATDGETAEDKAPAPKRKEKRAKGMASDSAVQEAPSQRKRVRGKRGILQKMTDTPLDVLFEIFSYLDPIDLLRISRTTKDLRQLLMSKSSAFIWERARLATQGIPPKPDDLNDPQYINLLFDRHCHECGNGFTQSVQWEVRLRLCKYCLESNAIMTANVEHLARLSPRYQDLAIITPKYTLIASSGRYSSRRTTYYHLATYQRLVTECKNTSDFRAWFPEQIQKYTALANSCKPYERWLTTKKKSRTAELAALREKRLMSILGRLQADGWAEELKDYDALQTIRSHKLANQAKALTDRIWDNIEPTLTAVMSGIRDELLAKKIRTAVPRRIRLVMDLCKSILSGMPEIPVIPDSSIIPSLQPFQDMIKNTPYDQDLLEDDFAEAVTTLPDICASWRQQQENELQSKLSALGRDADLSLAANAFTCAHCSSHPVLHYPYFASHGCFIVRSNIDGILTTSWDYTRIKAVDEDIRTKCEDIIRLCGLDPASATIQDLDATDAFFRCDYCQTRLWQPLGSKVSYLMRWRAAMNHEHFGRLERVTDPEFLTRAKAEMLSSLKLEVTSQWFSAYAFVCNHCGVVPVGPENRVEHLRTVHGIADGLENHYARSVKNVSISSGLRVDVPVTTPDDTSIEASTAGGAGDTTTIVTGDAAAMVAGEEEAEDLGPQDISSSSIAPLDFGAEEGDTGDTMTDSE